jgi:hypothetical protein
MHGAAEATNGMQSRAKPSEKVVCGKCKVAKLIPFVLERPFFYSYFDENVGDVR